MNYIVVDLEWNQPLSFDTHVYRQVGDRLMFEMIQIGAVKVGENFEVIDSISIPIKPTHYVKIHPHIRRLTHLGKEELADAPHFLEAMDQFAAWCGEDYTLLTWGCDDVSVLQQNVDFFRVERDLPKMYDIQRLYAAAVGKSGQTALKTAMEIFEIEATRPAHDALGDAFHTAQICAKLDLEKGAREYGAALKSHENGFHGAELPGCIARKVYYDFADKRAALSAMAGEENLCPVCGSRMLGSRWFAQPGHRYMDLATCPEHGKFLIRVRLSEQPDGLVRVSRLTYEATSEAAVVYARRAEKADPEERTGTKRHRRRSRLPEK